MAKTLANKQMVLRWQPERLADRMRRAVARAAAQAAAMVERETKELMSVQGPLSKKQMGRMTTQQKQRIADMDLRASKPGEPLRKRTGAARSSVMSEQVSETVYKVGYSTAVPYAAYWELHPDAPRPGLMIALRNKKPQIVAMLKAAAAE